MVVVTAPSPGRMASTEGLLIWTSKSSSPSVTPSAAVGSEKEKFRLSAVLSKVRVLVAAL